MSRGQCTSVRLPDIPETTSFSIIEPLASRCSKFRFTPLDSSSTSSRLMHIATAEHVDVTPEVVATLIDTSNGDLRRSITYLQSASRLSASTTPPIPITPRDIEEIAGVVPNAAVNDFARTLGIDIEGDIQMDNVPADPKRESFDAIRKKVRSMMREGYSASQLLAQVSRAVESSCMSLTGVPAA
jgi:replication factor C subunit 2/4